MLKIKTSLPEHPIILIQDTCQGNISTTTEDILNQLKLPQYNSLLKNVDLDLFMQLTKEKDFEQYGIIKQKHCRRLSQCALSIRRTSFTSSISSTTSTEESEDVDLTTEYSDSSMVTPSTKPTTQNVSYPSSSPPLLSPSISAITEEAEQAFSLHDIESEDFEDDDFQTQVWPNSIITICPPPKYIEDHRRYSLSILTPPEYVDSLLDKRRNNSFSEGSRHKVPGEGNEILPGYTCTVQKMGRVKAKVEYTSPNNKALFRPWKDMYLELQGTILKVHEILKSSAITGGYHYLPTLRDYYQEPIRYSLLYTLPLAETKADIPTDYTKRDHVFRITAKNGPQLLIQVQTNVSVSAWIEKLASGSNIAVDLEHQRMPHFTHSPTEPYHGWGSSDTIQRYQRYVIEELNQRNLSPMDPLV